LKDLVVLAADRSIEVTIRGLLDRPKAIGIHPVEFDIYTHPRRDPGCYRQAHELLGPLLDQYKHALVVFDRVGSGSSDMAIDMEGRARALLAGSGWRDRAAVVVIDPELEVWVWSDSPKVDEALHWAGRKPALRQWIRERGLWPPGQPKPGNPKRAVEAALWEVHIPASSSIFLALARTVSVERCVDPAFGRLRDRLGSWFPA
jgi:hypothetical protein